MQIFNVFRTDRSTHDRSQQINYSLTHAGLGFSDLGILARGLNVPLKHNTFEDFHRFLPMETARWPSGNTFGFMLMGCQLEFSRCDFGLFI